MRTQATLSKLNRCGINIFIATGRSVNSVVDYLKQLNFNTNTPIVCYNGSYVAILNSSYDIERVIFNGIIQPEHQQLLLNFASEIGAVAQYYVPQTGEVYACPKSDEHVELLGRYARLVGRQQVILSSYEDISSQYRAAKILLLTTDADDLMAKARDRFPADMFHVIRGSPHPFFVEFLPLGVDKGHGLRLLCDHLRLPLGGVVAFGDGDNDKELLRAAGLGCAMKNAHASAKEAAKLTLQVCVRGVLQYCI
jgi:Cof subfamily protein (haloacid dehalogenase superfamily)